MNSRRLWIGAAAAGIFSLCVLAAPAVRGGDEVKLKYASIAPAGSHWDRMMKKWTEKVKEESADRLRPTGFMGGAFGGELEMISRLEKGAIQCAGISSAALAAWVPELQVFEIPFLWSGKDEVYYVIDNYLKKPVAEQMRRKGFFLLAWTENGWRNFHSRQKPIRTPADLIGLKVRSQESKIHLEFWKELKATATAMPMNEVLPAFQSGIIDAGENNIIMMLAAGWAKYIKYITISNHIYQPALVFCNAQFIEGLSADLRKILIDSASLIEETTRLEFRDDEKKNLDALRAAGIEIVELTPAQRNAFASAVSGVEKKFISDVGGNLLAEIKKGKAAFNQGVGR